MKKSLFSLLVFFPALCFSQIKSDKNIFFNAEIDSMMIGLRNGNYHQMLVTIKNDNEIGDYAMEKFIYTQVNDSILEVKRNKQSQRYVYKNGYYQIIDDRPIRKYSTNDRFKIEKDSSGFSILREYVVKKNDTTQTLFISIKRDAFGRATNYIFDNGQHHKVLEADYSTSGDTLIMKESTIMRSGNHDFLSTDSTVCKTYWKGKVKIIEKRYKRKENTALSFSTPFFSSSSKKTIVYNKKKRISSIEYAETNSTGKKEKVQLEVLYY